MAVDFNWFPGHMNKTLKAIETKIPVVDLVIEILDARAPYSSRNATFAKLLKHKPLIYVLSKADLADPIVTQQWIDYFRKKKIEVLVLNNRHADIVKPLITLINQTTAAKQARDRQKGMVHSLINVLVIGIPNVGKSTFINRLVKHKTVKVGNKPGLTRGIQIIHLSDYISLLDTPGVLPSKLESEFVATNICAINSIKSDVYPQERIAARLIQYIFNNYENAIEDYYKISPKLQRPIQISETVILFEMIAKQRKWFITEELIDYNRVISHFMQTTIDQKFGNISFEKVLDIVPEAINKAVKVLDDQKFTEISDLW